MISYEENYPYGSTSYQAGRSAAETSLKRYRYTGKERDEETGLYYHGARSYAPWLGRWTSCDPAGLRDSLGLYDYVAGNPTNLHDPTGREGKKTFGGLSVSPASRISAQQWVDMIQKNEKLAPWMKSMFAAKGNRIVLTSDNIPTPPGVGAADIPAWFTSAVTAIMAEEWHVTTGVSTVSERGEGFTDYVTNEDKLLPDNEPGDLGKGYTHYPKGAQIVGETITSESKEPSTSMASRRMKNYDAAGATVPGTRRPATRNKPAEGLIVIADRYRDKKDAGLDISRDQDHMVETLFHELAAHAGVITLSKTEEEFDQSYHGSKNKPTEADKLADSVRIFFGNASSQHAIDTAKWAGPTGWWQRELFVQNMQAQLLWGQMHLLMVDIWNSANPEQRNLIKQYWNPAKGFTRCGNPFCQ